MLRRRIAANGVVYYASPLLESVGVPHAFSTRLGGVSPPPFDSLNLGNPSGCELQDDTPRIHENYARLQSAVGLGGFPRCSLHQVHGPAVHRVRVGEPFANDTKGDALVGDDPNRVLAVRVADCVPVLLASADGRAVAAVHAGWRGVVSGVIPAAVAELRALAGRTPLLATVGPCIGPDAFEVGPEVLAEFTRCFGPDAPIRRGRGAARKRGTETGDSKGDVDLREAIRRQLMSVDFASDCIDACDRCTFRDADEFFSHRRDQGITGRMAALIAPRGVGATIPPRRV